MISLNSRISPVHLQRGLFVGLGGLTAATVSYRLAWRVASAAARRSLCACSRACRSSAAWLSSSACTRHMLKWQYSLTQPKSWMPVQPLAQTCSQPAATITASH